MKKAIIATIFGLLLIICALIRIHGQNEPTETVQNPICRLYTVQCCDTLSEIAQENGCSVSDLKYVNDIYGTTIYEGQTLWIPISK